MFLEDLFNTDYGRKISKYDKESCTYAFMYRYWRDSLFERVMRLFVWENTGKVNPKEIEQRLILQGYCGVTKIKNEDELTAVFGSFYGPTKYIDEFVHFTYHCPIDTGSRTIGEDIIVINNNALRNPTYALIHHYATLIAHNEVTLINILINARDSGGIPCVSTEKQKNSVEEYQAKIFNGQYGTVTDIGNLGIEYLGTNRETKQELMAVMETREKLIKSFYSDIGVRSSFEKRNNTVQAEVEADTSLLLLNLSDMLKQREDACKEINKLFNVNWSVHIAEEIDYGTENQREQFDTSTETHVVVDKEIGGSNNA